MRLLDFLIGICMISGGVLAFFHQYGHAQCSFCVAGILQMLVLEKRINSVKRELQRQRNGRQ